MKVKSVWTRVALLARVRVGAGDDELKRTAMPSRTPRQITTFLGPELIPRFGLPDEL